jgi:membrane protease YdiL (CAAX protease family)
MSSNGDYLRATRHPWPCLLFLLPLLAAYELGVHHLGGAQPDALRNGADSWLRQGFVALGLPQHYWPPALLLAVLGVWNYVRRDNRPGDLVSVLSGMGLESIGFALGLWGISRGLGPLVDYLGLELNAGPSANPALGQFVTFLGAGIYEELLFRLLLFSGLLALLRRAGTSSAWGVVVAALLSATIFSAAHHLGPHGESFDGYNFLFRSIAGLYFAALYQFRGFGIAVGAHACYDVIVGVVVG